MSSNQKNFLPPGASRRWKHPLVFAAALVGCVGSSAVYYAHIRARQKARSGVFSLSFDSFVFSIIRCLGLFLEQSFFEEALDLTRGYKPITEKLVEPIQSLQIDTTNRFNHLSAYVAQVSRSIFSFLFSLRCAVLHRWLRKNGSTDRSMCRVILVFQIKSSNRFFLSKIFDQ